MGTRDEYEGDLFRRYEARIVTLELKVEALEGDVKKYAGIVDVLHEASLVAAALKVKLERARLGTLSRVQIAVAVAAILVPPFLSAALTLLIVRV